MKAPHQYKYTIYDRLRKLNVNDYEIAMQFLPEKLGITRGTFRNWIYIKVGEKLDLPALAVLKLAVFFGCEPVDIFSQPFQETELIKEWETLKNIAV
jgi:hypothetical protein